MLALFPMINPEGGSRRSRPGRTDDLRFSLAINPGHVRAHPAASPKLPSKRPHHPQIWGHGPAPGARDSSAGYAEAYYEPTLEYLGVETETPILKESAQLKGNLPLDDYLVMLCKTLCHSLALF